VAWPDDELYSGTRGTLGDRGSGWKRRPYSYGSDSSLGEEDRGRLDGIGPHQYGSSVPGDQQGWQNWGDGMTPKVLWEVVKGAAARAGIEKLAPHDLRRPCARLCHLSGGELDQIQFLLGHVSIQTTERYLGCKQKLRIAVNDKIGIEPSA